MNTSYPFLARLALDEHAVMRDVKRSYARELKLIDQEHDAAGFQSLREAYEHALAWLKHKEWQAGAHEPDGAAPPPAAGPRQAPLPPAPLPPAVSLAKPAPGPAPFLVRTEPQADPGQLAQQALARFAAASEPLTHGDLAQDLVVWREALERTLGADALLNLSARMLFERAIAYQLAGGWRPGHQALFVAACKVFGWTADPRRLQVHGQAGDILARAIHERHLFDSQPLGIITAQSALVARLRLAAPPGKRELVSGMEHIHALAGRFPTWLPLVTNVDNIAQWVAADEALSGWQRKLIRKKGFFGPARPQAPAQSGSGWSKLAGFVAVIAIVRGLAGVGSEPETPPRSAPDYALPAPPAAGPVTGAPWDTSPAPWSGAPGAVGEGPRNWSAAALAPAPAVKTGLTQVPGRHLADEEMDAIGKRIVYTLARDFKGQLKVAVAVVLDAAGKVVSVTVRERSSDSAFDRAVSDAIKASPPFPKETARRFGLFYTRAWKKPNATAPATPGPVAVEAPPVNVPPADAEQVTAPPAEPEPPGPDL